MAAKLPNKGDKNVSSAQVQTRAAMICREAAPITKSHDDAKIAKVLKANER